MIGAVSVARPSPVLLALAAVFLGCVLDAIIKHLGSTYSALLIATARYIAGSCIAATFFFGARKTLPDAGRLKAHALRAGAMAASAVLFFHALSVLTLAQATVVGFAAPMLIAPMARVLLKEPIRPAAAAAICVGFLGVVVTVVGAPGLASAPVRWDGAAAAIGAAFFYALQIVLLRQLSQREDALTNTLTGNVFPALYLLPFALAAGTAPAPEHLPWFAALGGLGVGLWWLMSRAYARAPAQRLAATEYSALGWSAAIGFIIFNEIPRPATLMGAVLIALAIAVAARPDAPASTEQAGSPPG